MEIQIRNIMKKQIRNINKEIDSLSELKKVKETAKFVFDRVIDGKMSWDYGWDDGINHCDDDETGIFVDLITGRVFATTDYHAFSYGFDEEKTSIFNITDATFCNLSSLYRKKYTVEHVEYAILNAVASLRCRFFTQAPHWEDYADLEEWELCRYRQKIKKGDGEDASEL